MTVWLVFEIEGHDNHELVGVFATRKVAEQWIDSRKNPLPFFIEDWVVLGEKQ